MFLVQYRDLRALVASLLPMADLCCLTRVSKSFLEAFRPVVEERLKMMSIWCCSSWLSSQTQTGLKVNMLSRIKKPLRRASWVDYDEFEKIEMHVAFDEGAVGELWLVHAQGKKYQQGYGVFRNTYRGTMTKKSHQTFALQLQALASSYTWEDGSFYSSKGKINWSMSGLLVVLSKTECLLQFLISTERYSWKLVNKNILSKVSLHDCAVCYFAILSKIRTFETTFQASSDIENPPWLRLDFVDTGNESMCFI